MMREKTGGRQKGTPNKISSQIKEKLSLLIDETIDTNEKEENDEVEGMSDTDDTEETE